MGDSVSSCAQRRRAGGRLRKLSSNDLIQLSTARAGLFRASLGGQAGIGRFLAFPRARAYAWARLWRLVQRFPNTEGTKNVRGFPPQRGINCLRDLRAQRGSEGILEAMLRNKRGLSVGGNWSAEATGPIDKAQRRPRSPPQPAPRRSDQSLPAAMDATRPTTQRSPSDETRSPAVGADPVP